VRFITLHRFYFFSLLNFLLFIWNRLITLIFNRRRWISSLIFLCRTFFLRMLDFFFLLNILDCWFLFFLFGSWLFSCFSFWFGWHDVLINFVLELNRF
jgi:hypothetical protein